eukprot:365861-Chlamydomonas_euryale.AAC.25
MTVPPTPTPISFLVNRQPLPHQTRLPLQRTDGQPQTRAASLLSAPAVARSSHKVEEVLLLHEAKLLHEPRVHLHEVERPLWRAHVNNKLHGAGVDVPRGACRAHRRVPNLRVERVGQARRRRLLNDLLVAALQTAVAVKHAHAATVPVTHHLAPLGRTLHKGAGAQNLPGSKQIPLPSLTPRPKGHSLCAPAPPHGAAALRSAQSARGRRRTRRQPRGARTPAHPAAHLRCARGACPCRHRRTRPADVCCRRGKGGGRGRPQCINANYRRMPLPPPPDTACGCVLQKREKGLTRDTTAHQCK